MTQQPEALRLADSIDPITRNGIDNLTCHCAASELRRLHEENKRLKAAQPKAEQEPKREPQFKEFIEWANDVGHDTAHTHDGVNWLCLNPMTADLWTAWQAAHGIKGEA